MEENEDDKEFDVNRDNYDETVSIFKKITTS